MQQLLGNALQQNHSQHYLQQPQQQAQVGQQAKVKEEHRKATAVPAVPAPADTKGGSSKRVRDNNSNKQAKLKELETIAAQKAEEMARLLQQNQDLKFKHSILEKVVALRTNQLNVLRSGHGDPAPLPPPPTLSGVDSGCPSSAASAAGNAAAAAAGPRHPPPVPGGLPPGQVAAGVRLPLDRCASGVPHYVRSMPPVDKEKYRSMGKLQVLEAWKHFLSDASQAMLALEANPEDDEAASVMQQAVAEVVSLLRYCSLLAPDTYLAVMQTHLETYETVSPDAEHWRAVLRTLELSPQQQAELRGVHELFEGIMRGILAERQAINRKLADGSHGDVSEMLRQMTISTECEVLQTYMKNLRKEKAAHLLLRGFLFGHCLTVLQFVRAAVYSYPYYPDSTALVVAMLETCPPGTPAASNNEAGAVAAAAPANSG